MKDNLWNDGWKEWDSWKGGVKSRWRLLVEVFVRKGKEWRREEKWGENVWLECIGVEIDDGRVSWEKGR